MQPYLALITPLSGGHPDQGLPPQPVYPDQGLPGQPPGIWPSPGHPAHPIAPGGRPPGIWGGPPSYPDQGLPPGGSVGVWPSPGVPTHPWVPPAGEELPPPPEDIANSYVVAVWNPTKAEWSVSVAEGATPKAG
jgi:hypothetical protein